MSVYEIKDGTLSTSGFAYNEDIAWAMFLLNLGEWRFIVDEESERATLIFLEDGTKWEYDSYHTFIHEQALSHPREYDEYLACD